MVLFYEEGHKGPSSDPMHLPLVCLFSSVKIMGRSSCSLPTVSAALVFLVAPVHAASVQHTACAAHATSSPPASVKDSPKKSLPPPTVQSLFRGMAPLKNEKASTAALQVRPRHSRSARPGGARSPS
jgi:hypothetical protein